MLNSFRYILLLWMVLGCKEEHPPLKKDVRPNVLFIAVDDLRNELGVYGSIAKSPNMDALAAGGALFTHHYAQVPTCGASRHALLTGYRPSKAIHLSNSAIEVELSGKPEDSVPETFIHRFKQAGYHTVGIGKIGHSADGYVYGYEEPVSQKRELPHSWSELHFDAGKWKTGWNAFFGYANGENRQSLNKQVKPYEVGEVNDEGYPDGLTANLALSKLKELKDSERPFFMGVGFFKPHLPFNAPKKYWDLYDREEIPVSPNPGIPENVNLASLHESGEFNQYALGDEKAGLAESVSDAYAKKLRHGYLASISYIDVQIGKLLQELKNLGLEENTIVVIWGDHGWHLGDQRVWGKHTLFENALKSTLIIKTPNTEHRNKKVEAIVESVDLYPTLLDLCEIPLNHKVDGESLLPLMTSDNSKDQGTAYGYFKQGISLRTPDYRLTKYIRDEKPVIELYDHTGDNPEDKNIADERPEIVEKLMPILEEGDTGLYDGD